MLLAALLTDVPIEFSLEQYLTCPQHNHLPTALEGWKGSLSLPFSGNLAEFVWFSAPTGSAVSAKPCLVHNRALNKGLTSTKSSNIYEEDEKNDSIDFLVCESAAELQMCVF